MRRSLTLTLVLGLAVLVTGAVWRARRAPLARLDAFVAELRARGEPVNLDDVVAPPSPGETNGAGEIDAALSWLDANAAPDWQEHVVGPWSDEPGNRFYLAPAAELERLREQLAQFEPFFELVDAAASRDVIWWSPPDPDPTTGERSNSVVEMIVRVFQLVSARVHSCTDDAERLAALEVHFRVATRLRPTDGIAFLSRWIGLESAVESLRRGVETGVVDPRAARTRLDALLVHEPLEELPLLLRVERAFLIGVVSHVVDGSHPVFAGGPPLDELRDAVESVLGGRMPATRRAAGGALVDAIEDLTWAAELQPTRDGDYADWLDRHLGDDDLLFGRLFVQRCRQTQATLDLARAALAACEFRADAAHWPKTLDDLEPLLGVSLDANPHSRGPYELSSSGGVLQLDGRTPEQKLAPAATEGTPLRWTLRARDAGHR